MQSFQLEGENDTETSDNKKSDGQHIEHGNSTKSRLPDDSHRAKNSQNAKHQIPPPVLCAITHDLDTLFALSSRVAVLAEKRVIVTGSPREVAQFNHPFIHTFFQGERGRRAMAPAPVGGQ